MKKSIFIPNRWVKFLYKGEICIGITYFYDKKEKDKPLYQLVFSITQNRKKKIFNFYECVELKYLEFVEKNVLINDLSITKIQSSIDCRSKNLFLIPNIDEKIIKQLAVNQINKISKN